MGRSCSGSTQRQFALAAGVPDWSHTCGTERPLWIGALLWRHERPRRPELAPLKLCDRFQKILRLLVVPRRGALFQSVHSLIPERSLRAGVPSTEPGVSARPMPWIRSQGLLCPGPLAPAHRDSGRRPDDTLPSRHRTEADESDVAHDRRRVYAPFGPSTQSRAAVRRSAAGALLRTSAGKIS